MDDKLRKLELRKHEDFQSKVSYVVSKLRAGEISEKDVRLASQLGNPVAQAIIKQPVLRSHSTILKQIRQEVLIHWGVETIEQYFKQFKLLSRSAFLIPLHHLQNAARGLFLNRIEDIEEILERIRMTSHQLGIEAERYDTKKAWDSFFGWRALEEFWIAAQMDSPNRMRNFLALLSNTEFQFQNSLSRLGDFLLRI